MTTAAAPPPSPAAPASPAPPVRRTRTPDRLTDLVLLITAIFGIWGVGLVILTAIGIAQPNFYLTGEKANIKVAGATVVAVLALLQGWSMYSAMGKIPHGNIRIRTLMRLHRYGGRIAILLAAFIAFFCMTDIGAPHDPLRVAVHVSFGATAFAALAVKFTLIRIRPALAYDLAPWLGGYAAFAFVVVWASSALAYYTGNL